MSRGFTSIIWAWDLNRQSKKLEAVYSLGNSLEMLALTQQEQDSSIPDCVFCELYFPFKSAYDLLVKEVMLYVPLDLQVSLSQIDREFDSLMELEETCFNRGLLKEDNFDRIRTMSRQSMEQMEWKSLIDYRDYLSSN
jgi:hypothetical protein